MFGVSAVAILLSGITTYLGWSSHSEQQSATPLSTSASTDRARATAHAVPSPVEPPPHNVQHKAPTARAAKLSRTEFIAPVATTDNDKNAALKFLNVTLAPSRGTSSAKATLLEIDKMQVFQDLTPSVRAAFIDIYLDLDERMIAAEENLDKNFGIQITAAARRQLAFRRAALTFFRAARQRGYTRIEPMLEIPEFEAMRNAMNEFSKK